MKLATATVTSITATATATVSRQSGDTICIQLPNGPGVVMTAAAAESMAYTVLDLVARMRNGWA